MSHGKEVSGAQIFLLPICVGQCRDFWLIQPVWEGPQPLGYEAFTLHYQEGFSPSTPLPGMISNITRQKLHSHSILPVQHCPSTSWHEMGHGVQSSKLYDVVRGCMTQYLNIHSWGSSRPCSGVVRIGKPVSLTPQQFWFLSLASRLHISVCQLSLATIEAMRLVTLGDTSGD